MHSACNSTTLPPTWKMPAPSEKHYEQALAYLAMPTAMEQFNKTYTRMVSDIANNFDKAVIATALSGNKSANLSASIDEWEHDGLFVDSLSESQKKFRSQFESSVALVEPQAFDAFHFQNS